MREKIAISHSIRARYDYVADRVKETISQPDANIFLISQAGIYRDDFWFLKSLVRPLVIDNHNYYISPNGVLDMTGIEDITKVTNAQTQPTKMSAEQWKNVLKDNYDFVLLYNIDESFRENYHSVFLDPTTIFPDSLYQVQEDGSLLYIHFAAECV